MAASWKPNLQLVFLGKVQVVRYEGPRIGYKEIQEVYRETRKGVKSRWVSNYLREVNESVLKTYLDARSRGARFGVDLHSTEKLLDVIGRPWRSDHIELLAIHHFDSPRNRSALECYRVAFHRKFKDNHSYHVIPAGNVAGPHPDIITLEFFNNPRYVRRSEAEDMLRHFLSYTVRFS